MIENELKTIWNESGRIFTIIRPTNPVGEFQRHARLSWTSDNCYRQYEKKAANKVYGNGETVETIFM